MEGSSDNLYSVSSVERRRQAKARETKKAAAGSSSSLKRRQLKYNLAKYKLSRSGRKVKRRVESLAGRRTVKQQWQVGKIQLELVVTALRMWRFSCFFCCTESSN